MDIRNIEKGEKVECVKTDGGYAHDELRGKKFLKIGNEYTVDRWYTNKKSTSVFFEEIPNISFNSIYFKNT